MNCRDSVVAWLTTAKRPLPASRLAQRTGYTVSAVNYTLHQLVLDGKVERLGERGTYRFRLKTSADAAPRETATQVDHTS